MLPHRARIGELWKLTRIRKGAYVASELLNDSKSNQFAREPQRGNRYGSGCCIGAYLSTSVVGGHGYCCLIS